MYAKIINQTTKECSVGLGTNTTFYQKLGMTEMDVEKAFNGRWYVKGYAPEKTADVVKSERIEELRANLEASNGIVLEVLETALMNGGNLAIPAGEQGDEYSTVLSNRAAWRAELSELLK